MKRAIVSLSGGLDSTVAMALTMEKGYECRSFAFCYGSKHNPYENEAAVKIARYYGITHQLIDISSIMSLFKSSLLKTGGDIPEGHYAAENMRSTVVPCRNIIFASILSGIADSLGFDMVVLGVHSSDSFIYPDCRKGTNLSLNNTILQATETRVKISTPLIDFTKTEVVREGIRLKVPFELTRSCYKDQPIACGKCGTCVERLEAFENNGMKDPIPYQD